ncbi:MAG TPA: cytochrome c oxidase subunit II [Candidatus Binataceae bacterium]|nr:cytochrome c oxidase subunit II [Candidatus Binataceae bacterium]
MMRYLRLVMLGLMLGGCGDDRAHPMSTMAPRSDLANWCYSMFLEVTAWDFLILAIVIVAFILAVFFFSTRVGEAGPPTAVSSDLKLEIAWTLGPALILLFISIPTVRLIFRTQPRTAFAGELPITVIAHQWWWEFHYDDGSGAITANELHVPVNRPIHLKLVSNDVIHSFWVPRLGGKRDVVPGQVNEIHFSASVPGEYYGQCAEFCGDSHANMRFRIFVDKPGDFAMWEKAQAAPGAMSAGDTSEARGARVFANSPCTTCHTVNGVSKGYVGPDLTHLASRSTIAAGVMPNDPQHLTEWIEHPDELKPGARMPDFGLRGAELNDLVAYLESLK